jgi:hypothetical protein
MLTATIVVSEMMERKLRIADSASKVINRQASDGSITRQFERVVAPRGSQAFGYVCFASTRVREAVRVCLYY